MKTGRTDKKAGKTSGTEGARKTSGFSFGGRKARIAAISAIAGAVLLIAFFVFIAPGLVKARIYAYGLDPKEISALTAVAREYGKIPGNAPLSVLASPTGMSPADMVKKAKGGGLVCFRPSPAFSGLADRFSPLPKDIAELAPPALLRLTSSERGAFALPLIVDHGQIAVDAAVFLKAGVTVPSSIPEFESAAPRLAAKGIVPLSVAGGDDRSLLLLVSYLVAAPEGIGPYEVVLKAIASGKDFKACLDAGSGKASLRGALSLAAQWIKKGYLHSDCLDWKDADIRSFMESDRTAMVLCYLSESRDFGDKALGGYDTARFFSSPAVSLPSAVSPVLAAGIPFKSGQRARLQKFLRYAASAKGQEILSSAAGGGPASAAVSSTDRAASQARAWALSSDEALQGLDSAFADASAMKAFCGEIRAFIKGAIFS